MLLFLHLQESLLRIGPNFFASSSHLELRSHLACELWQLQHFIHPERLLVVGAVAARDVVAQFFVVVFVSGSVMVILHQRVFIYLVGE